MDEEKYLSFFSTELGKKINDIEVWGFNEAYAFAEYFYNLGKSSV